MCSSTHDQQCSPRHGVGMQPLKKRSLQVWCRHCISNRLHPDCCHRDLPIGSVHVSVIARMPCLLPLNTSSASSLQMNSKKKVPMLHSGPAPAPRAAACSPVTHPVPVQLPWVDAIAVGKPSNTRAHPCFQLATHTLLDTEASWQLYMGSAIRMTMTLCPFCYNWFRYNFMLALQPAYAPASHEAA